MDLAATMRSWWGQPAASGQMKMAKWAKIAPKVQSSEVRIDNIQLAVNACAAADSLSAANPTSFNSP